MERKLHNRRVNGADQRAWGVDLRWGIARSLLLTGICLTPAAFVFVVTLVTGRLPSGQGSEAAKLFAQYLAMAVAGGLVLGACRPMLRTRNGTLAVGAFVGAAMFLGLWLGADASQVGRTRLLVFFAVLGAAMGALTAAYIRARWGDSVNPQG